MSQFKESTFGTTGTIGMYCEKCGKAIEGEPYETSMDASCACVNPVYFCSKECWESSEMFNTDNWG